MMGGVLIVWLSNIYRFTDAIDKSFEHLFRQTVMTFKVNIQ